MVICDTSVTIEQLPDDGSAVSFSAKGFQRGPACVPWERFFFGPQPVRPTTAWAARRLHRRRHDAPLLGSRGRVSQYRVYGRRHFVARRLVVLISRRVLFSVVLMAALTAAIVGMLHR